MNGPCNEKRCGRKKSSLLAGVERMLCIGSMAFNMGYCGRLGAGLFRFVFLLEHSPCSSSYTFISSNGEHTIMMIRSACIFHSVLWDME
jgi:hypothetical protein